MKGNTAGVNMGMLFPLSLFRERVGVRELCCAPLTLSLSPKGRGKYCSFYPLQSRKNLKGNERSVRSSIWKFLLPVGTLSLVLVFSTTSVLAADATAPTTPVVTDDGTYTTVTTSLHATWTSSDPESGIAEYQYLIRQDSTSGAIIVNWTSTGTTASVTHTGLSLLQGKNYYFQIKAKNGDGLWSAIGSSNGIKVDTTVPSAPGLPKEGSSSTDYDFDGDGSYTVYWAAAADAESGLSAYEVQEQVGSTGAAWTTLTNNRTTTNFAVSGRLDRTWYAYRVRAKNGAGLWGNWSSASDGILIDKTVPSIPATVTDDGATTFSITQLHATWSPSSDAESGILLYDYIIRQDSTSGPTIVNYTSVGLSTEVTRTGLSLVNGKKYYVGVRAKNGALLYSSVKYSDGITVQQNDTTPPSGTIQINNNATYTMTLSVTLNLSATDDIGPVTQMQFSNDNVTYGVPESYATTKAWTLTSGDGSKTVYVKFKDAAGNWSVALTDTITLDTVAPDAVITYPVDGALLGRQ